MGKNEIKLRRKVLNPLDVDRYRDYARIMKRHQRDNRYQRIVRFFTFSLIVTVVVILLLLTISFLWFKIR